MKKEGGDHKFLAGYTQGGRGGGVIKVCTECNRVGLKIGKNAYVINGRPSSIC